MTSEFRELNTLLGRIDGAYHDICTKMGLSDTEFSILYVLCESEEGCNQSVLYKSYGLGRSTVNTCLRKMEKEGYLKTVPGEGKNTRVILTAAGKALSERTVQRIIEIENRIYFSWPVKKRELFFQLNQDYLNAFQEATSTLEVERK